MTTTRPTRPFRRLRDDPSDLEAAYFRWIKPDPAADPITDRVEHIVRTHLELGAVRRPGTALTRVSRSESDEGLGPVVQVVNDDMPLLVDSVTEALRQLGANVLEVAHPVFDVARDEVGRLRSIAARPADGAAIGSDRVGTWFAESWIHIRLSPAHDARLLDRIECELPRVLCELRQVSDDTPAMVATLRALAERLDPEYAALLTWLVDGNFTVLGYRGYRFRESGSVVVPEVRPVPEASLGILRAPEAGDAELGQFRFDGPPVRIGNGSIDSALHGSREVYLVGVADYGTVGSGLPCLDGAPEQPVVGEHVFFGTFTVAGLHENVLDIPVIAHRVRQVINWAGYQLNSFSGQVLLEFLQSYPRAELFTIDARRLFETVSAVTNLSARRQVRLFLRPGAHGAAIYCLVYLPRDRYSSEVRQRIQDILQAEFGGDRVVYSARVTESDLAIAYFTVHRKATTARADISDANRQRVQELIFAATRTWGDRFVALAAATVEAAVLRDYAAAFPPAYQQDHEPPRALADLRRLERLGECAIDTHLYRQAGAPLGEWRFALYVAGAGLSLSTVLPMLQSLGVEVIDERPYAVATSAGQQRWIYDFGLRVPQGLARSALDRTPPVELEFADDYTHQRISTAFEAMWQHRAEIDGLNELVLRAGLAWRQIAVLRAYSHYLQQAGFAYSFGNITRVLLAHPRLARLFIELFGARFDPEGNDSSATDRAAALEVRLRAEIDTVAGLDADRILRAILGLITATLRTNYYRRDDAGTPLEYLSFKLDPTAVAELPKPRPQFEIFVYSPRVAGVHLRFGPVARGGLRWSDRLEDFRTEILGLVKAQAVKNAVIVPVGAKGGFVVRRPPLPTGDPSADRAATQAEGIACYRTFIRGLLDLTDNIEHRTGAAIPPAGVVCHDGADTYLVVAADKGTATFSDIANAVAREYGFWLGDAFASGGSVGYDHKAMGITAKGAWESVRRHFAEMDLDVQTQDFTVVGIGDMSGDVFGNAMLLSDHIRLIAAFDHRHIFLDPNPDATRSFQERTRMFALPRSSWADYDATQISAGGGVFDRSAKGVPVSAEVRAVLGLDAEVTVLSPPEMIKAILRAPADLLWNGGIGTYVKSGTETHAEVGDKSNDAVRVNADQVRVKVIGEGGNLGITALGRIEFCRAGGKCNTDAMDNSAGVDCSDHEVNIKIVVDAAVSAGELTAAQRESLLSEMTAEVAALVLRDNISQNTLLGSARANAASMVSVHARLLADLEARRGLDRQLEALPSDTDLSQRAACRQGLTSPELSTLLAHVKLALKADLQSGDLLDSAAFAARLPTYFPTPLRERFLPAIGRHPLRGEIIATVVVNDMVDNGGITYAFRLAEEVGASTEDAVRAFVTAAEIFDLHSLWQRIRTSPMPTAARDELELEVKRTLDRASRWLLANRPQPIAIGADIARYRAGVRELSAKVPSWRGPIALDMVRRSHAVIERGAPRDLAEETFLLIHRFPLLDVLDIADLAEHGPGEVMTLYYALDEHLAIQQLLAAVGDLARVDRWQTLARLALRDDLYSSLRALTLDVLAMSDPKESAAEKIAYWESTNRARLMRARAALHQLVAVGTHDLATLSVAARQVRGMISGGEAAIAAARCE
ncbi:NAD-glutamate dehydrogenase [Nocardia brasiliensis]|uniref:NAD-glutamate dehydrogenase n=1 Tax=Nocardia brasiliensis TaxID=37326 RepID=UPI002455252F|nr:NAD-glutamate dehydrogenase [Nocardia brasiliensis]